LPTGGSFEPSASPVPNGENEKANWVFVIRGATVHSGPSVSAPTVRFYSVGTELQLIDYQQGWFQVLDPVTLQRGWIYEKYYHEAIRGPGQQLAVQDLPSTTRVALAAPKPKPVSRVKKPRPQQKIAKSRPQPSKRIPRSHDEFASLIERAFRGY
jgi:hypothetical protein